MDAVVEGLRARKKARLREQLVEAAIELFAERGFEETTVDAIAAAVDTSRRTFFRYFATKEDVVTAWLETDRFRLRDALVARPKDEPPMDSIRHAFAYLAGVVESERAKLVAIERVAARCPALRGKRQEKFERLAQIVTEVLGPRLGQTKKRDLAPRLLGNLAMAAAQSAFDAWIAGGARGNLAALMDEALGYIHTGELASRATSEPRSRRPSAR